MTQDLTNAGVRGSPIRVSVIVPTHNRRASVFRLLGALRAQVTAAGDVDSARFEVIVVADGCNDDTIVALARSITDREWPFELTLVEQSPGRGAGIARNVGAAQAKGEILLFVDDDIEPLPTMLATHLASHDALAEGDALVLVGAPIPVRPTPASLHDIAAWGWWEQQFEAMGAPGHRFTYEEIFTGVLSMSAALFRTVGGFDESLGDCHEDSELGLRLFRAGARGGFSRAGGGVHHEMRDMHRLLPRKFAEGRADVRIAQRWPELVGYLRISWRRPSWRTLAGFVRINAFRAQWLARLLTRAALPVLSLLSRLRLRNQWRLLHGGTLVQSYWLGVAAEVGSEGSLASRLTAARSDWSRWSDATRWLTIDLAAGIERAEQLVDRNRPDALRVRLGAHEIGTIDPTPIAERLHGGHLRRLLATKLSHELRTALALREALSGSPTPIGGVMAVAAPETEESPRRQTSPFISVVVPAFNASRTLRIAVDSLLAQSFAAWEAIVVDDGSTDDTAAVVAEYAARDARIRLVQQPNGGLSAARNAGIAVASAPWLHFLDADDWMSPVAFERLTAALELDPTLDAVHCGWARVAEDGRVIAESRCWQVGDLFATFAVRCAIAVHACLVRRSLVIEAGAFDADFRITQDWVLWQRIARRGARFGRVGEVLAYYAFRADSLSSDPLPLLHEALRCIALGHGADPAIPHAKHRAGRPVHEMASAQLHYVAWIAGMRIGRDEDAVSLLEFVGPTSTPPAPMWVAESLIRALPHALGVLHEEWPRRWRASLPRLEAFLSGVERLVAVAGYARGIRVAMERAVAALVREESVTLGMHHVDFCECTESIEDCVPPPGCERLVLHVRVRGASIGLVELPVVDGVVRSDVLRDTIASTLAWPLLGAFFQSTRYNSCTYHDDGDSVSAFRDGRRIASSLPKEERARMAALHDAAGWELFLDDLWSGATAIGAADDGAIDDRAVVEGAGDDGSTSHGWRVIEVGATIGTVALVRGAADVVVTVGGVAVATLRLVGDGDSIAASQLPQRLTDAIGFELCRIAVREALVGRAWDSLASLRDGVRRAWIAARTRGAQQHAAIVSLGEAQGLKSDVSVDDAVDVVGDARARIDDAAFAPAWRSEVARHATGSGPLTIIARRDQRFIGGSGDRTYAIPASGRALALQLSRTNGTPTLEVSIDEGQPELPVSQSRPRALYLPSLRWRAVGTPAHVRTVAARNVGRDERVPDDFEMESSTHGQPVVTADRLPILMYHRVARSGPVARARWRVTPEAFSEQLSALAEHGYRSIRLVDWQRALDQGRPLPARPLLLTFDDGYDDFGTHAWPALQRHGFDALAFIVTGCVGSHNTWDAGAASESLMDWRAIRDLVGSGVEFGAHSVTHRRFTVLSPEAAFEEAARSRLELQDNAQTPVDTFAYPYGAEDPVVRHVTGAAGFQFGLSVRSGSARRHAPWLALPRIEVTGEDSVESLLAKLDE